jgi:hypothetical protein
MEKQKVVLFKPYPFEEGQLIHIESGPRRGDWKVIGVTERKVRLKCPVSHKEFDWDRFCYFVQERTDIPWPRKD